MIARQIPSGPRCPVVAQWLIAFAILLRVAVPAGWMPATDGFGLMPCPAAAAAPAMHAMHGAHHDGHREHQPGPDHPCAFAGFGAALLAPAEIGAAALPPPPPVPATLLHAAAVAIGRGLAAPPPPPTGPPLFR